MTHPQVKGERREQQRHKAQHGMRVSNTSIKLIAKLAITPKESK